MDQGGENGAGAGMFGWVRFVPSGRFHTGFSGKPGVAVVNLVSAVEIVPENIENQDNAVKIDPAAVEKLRFAVKLPVSAVENRGSAVMEDRPAVTTGSSAVGEDRSAVWGQIVPTTVWDGSSQPLSEAAGGHGVDGAEGGVSG